MLQRLTRKMRVRAAIGLAVLYAFCVVAGPAVAALGDSLSAAHCLTDSHHEDIGAFAQGQKHSHAEAEHAEAKHPKSKPVKATPAEATPATGAPDGTSEKKSEPVSCCGLFSVTALAVGIELSFGGAAFAGKLVTPPLASLVGQGPGQIKRPPRSLTSL